MVVRRVAPAALACLLALGGCAGLDREDQGTLQPQSVTGPCQVKKFYILSLTTVHTQMVVANTGQACVFTLINPALQIFNTAALVTGAPAHGQAGAGLLLAGTQGVAQYTPAAGYAGPDRFEVTLQPAARSIQVDVTVTAAN